MASFSTESEVMDAVLRMLAKRDYCEAEIRRKLLAKATAESLISPVIARVQELGYQSDFRYTESYIRYAVSQGKGPAWISAQLQRRGVDRVLIVDRLDCADVDWRSVAAEQLQRKFKSSTDDPKQLARQFRHLASRGFSPDIIRYAMDHHASECCV